MPSILKTHSAKISSLTSPAAVGAVLILAVVYAAAAKFGFLMAFQAAQVTVVWPPTGIAIAAVLLFGTRIWPGIFLGAFLANITSNEPFVTAFGIAVGNTLESVIGVWVMRRFSAFENPLGRLRDVWGLLIGAALIGTMISASIGVTSLCLDGVQPWKAWHSLWILWWIGDAASALIVAPVLLAWSRRPFLAWHTRSAIEATALIAGLIIVCMAMFTDAPAASIHGRAFTYPVFLFIIWAAIRFGQRGTTVVALIASGIAIWATLHSIGPFAGASVEQNLAMLQTFIGVVAVTGLFLSAAIAERHAAEAALQEAMRNKNEFLSTLAHELRNPLAPVANAVYMLRQPSVKTEQRNILYALIERQLQQIIRLVDDLVDVSRISRGKVELRKESIALADAIAIAMETTQPLMKERQHALSADLGNAPLWLHADLTRIAQIFANLLNNAAKYTPPGGDIRLEVKSDGDAAVITVRDTGIGIPQAVLPHIFDMFMQVESSLEISHGGLGIGLTLVKRLVELHGGKVAASSAGKGQGSEFTVRLPVIAPPAALVQTVKPDAGSAHRKFRILLADDNESFAETFGYMLEQSGHEVRLAHDGLSALDIAQSFQPEVVLLDIGLPKMNGYEVCQKMRAMSVMKDSVIIAQTGFSQPEHRERSTAAGFDYHLIKPIKIDHIEELLRSLEPALSNKAA